MTARRIALVLALTASAVAQSKDDQRDVVEISSGKEHRGRVARAYDPEEVLLQQGGKRVRIPRDRIRSMVTVNDHLREFFQLRSTCRHVIDREWMLVEWAASRGLDNLARIQALHVVTLDDQHEAAHEFLEHRQRQGTWRWRVGSRWLTRDQHDEHHADWGHPLELDGEHFRVRTNTGLRRGVDALMDLERCYVWWMDTFGPALRAREVFDLMEVHIHDGTEKFPAWTGNGFPYYFPDPNGDVSYTFIQHPAPTADLMFHLASEQILYNAVADGMGTGQVSPRDRIAAWIDVGLGQWVESSFLGEPGYAEPAKSSLDRSQAFTALQHRAYGLENLIGLRFGTFHDPTSQTPLHWANAAAFVAYLMDNPERRARFLEYVRLAYGESKGNSSSLLDRTLGAKIEQLEGPWVAWLRKQLGLKAGK